MPSNALRSEWSRFSVKKEGTRLTLSVFASEIELAQAAEPSSLIRCKDALMSARKEGGVRVQQIYLLASSKNTTPMQVNA